MYDSLRVYDDNETHKWVLEMILIGIYLEKHRRIQQKIELLFLDVSFYFFFKFNFHSTSLIHAMPFNQLK